MKTKDFDTPKKPESADESEEEKLHEFRPPAHFDPLHRYLAEIRRHPILDPEEEKALAIRYREKGDLEAAYKLVISNLRLVVKIALEYYNSWMTSVLDLIQEGNIGLMLAVKKFDPYRGVRLPYYASFWIRAYILRFIMENWRLVKVGTTQAQRKLFFNLRKEKERLEARLRDSAKLWKFSEMDVAERQYWDDYMNAYEDVLNKCSTKWAPWHIVPANKKWYRDLVVGETIVKTLEDLDMKHPEPKMDPSSIEID